MDWKLLFDPIMAILNIWWCLLALLMHPLFFNIWWTIFGWLCDLLDWWHFYFILKTWRNMKQHVWLILDKLEQVKFYFKFHKIKMEFLKCIFMKMTFVLFFIRSKPFWLGHPNLCLWCSIFSWIHQLLLVFHCTLFHDSFPFHSFNLKLSNFCSETWGQSVHFSFQSFFSQLPHF